MRSFERPGCCADAGSSQAGKCADEAAGSTDAIAADKVAIEAAKAQRATDRAKLEADVIAVTNR